MLSSSSWWSLGVKELSTGHLTLETLWEANGTSAVSTDHLPPRLDQVSSRWGLGLSALHAQLFAQGLPQLT